MKGQVQVYRNLNRTTESGRSIYSVRNDKGLVEGHVTSISLLYPVFRVSKAGNERVRKEKRKNVHAYIQGKRMKGKWEGLRPRNPENDWHRITYDPYKHEHFVLVDNESMRVVDAFIVEINDEGVWAFNPTAKEVNLLEV